MKNILFTELRKKAGYTQVKLASKLYTSITTIRNWENNIVIPNIHEMKLLSDALNVDLGTIMSIFRPDETMVKQNEDKVSEMYNLLLSVFWDCNTLEGLIVFAEIFSYASSPGIICYKDYVFPFVKILTKIDGDEVAFLDDSDNIIVLTASNVIEVAPMSTHYDIYTIDVIINCPMFPINFEFSPSSFRQKIRISFFNR